MRGAFFPSDSNNNECAFASINASTCFGGCDRRAEYIDFIRLSDPNTIVLDPGRYFRENNCVCVCVLCCAFVVRTDLTRKVNKKASHFWIVRACVFCSVFWGSLFFSAFNGTTMADCLRQTRYDAMSLGSGEFLNSYEYLDQFIEALPASMPVVSSNTLFDRHPVLSRPRANGGRPKVQPYVILERGGRKIGVVYVATYLGKLKKKGKKKPARSSFILTAVSFSPLSARSLSLSLSPSRVAARTCWTRCTRRPTSTAPQST